MKSENELIVMLGFDCDRPRGEFIFSKEGNIMAERKFKSINKISCQLKKLKIPRTYFICGQFLESMSKRFGAKSLQNIFDVKNDLVEIGDHTYSHSIVKSISSRPDKTPSSYSKIKKEFFINTKLFQEILDLDIPNRGFRTPLGHYNGLKGENKLLDVLKELKINYVSSDLRDKHESLNPPLKNIDGTTRQPYRYENNLLEIPTMGWQDTVFSGTTKTPLYEKPPSTYEEIISYYQTLFEEVKKIILEKNRSYYLGLTLHPYDNSFYNVKENFFEDLNKIILKFHGRFASYNDVCNEFNRKSSENR